MNTGDECGRLPIENVAYKMAVALEWKLVSFLANKQRQSSLSLVCVDFGTKAMVTKC